MISRYSFSGLGKPIWNATWTDQLKRDLFLHYDKYARPAQHYNVTTVQFGMKVYHISINEFKSAVDVRAYVKMMWTDDKLKWNASNYGELDHLQVGNHEIWQPDITLLNSVGTSSIEPFSDAPCHILQTGLVICTPPTQFLAICDLDFHLWPYDTQTCSIEIASWAYTGSQIELKFPVHGEAAEIEMAQHSEWTLIRATKLRKVTTYQCCVDQPLIRLRFNFTLKRNSTLYASVFGAPTVFIVFMNLAIFWLSPQSRERPILCSLLALIISLFLVYFTHFIPSSPRTPLIVSFYTGCLHQVTISLIISVAVKVLSRRPYCRPLPRVVKKILMGQIGKYLGLCDLVHLLQSQRSGADEDPRDIGFSESSLYPSNPLSNEPDNEDKENMISSSSATAQLEWILAATAVDRISFLIFCFVFSVMGMTYMC
ncbi:neuronal acetylcholine receptor subunit alpha-5-like isoform X2 [Diachasmimorpha longicaudata]|uniref:neuronal acetylcholine receptor subunit alpha-5-like isoform X2 n=1 Tax=Diachasmimorpha longicaudata TaxID=58733 RepID=UPI0030B88A64